MGEKQEDPLRKAVASAVIGSEEFREWVRRGVDREVPALRAIGKKPDITFIKEACERVFGEGGFRIKEDGALSFASNQWVIVKRGWRIFWWDQHIRGESEQLTTREAV